MFASGAFSALDEQTVSRVFKHLPFDDARAVSHTCRRFFPRNPAPEALNWRSMSRAVATGSSWLVCRTKRRTRTDGSLDVMYAALRAICEDRPEMAKLLLLVTRCELDVLLVEFLARKGLMSRKIGAARAASTVQTRNDYDETVRLATDPRARDYDLLDQVHRLALIHARNVAAIAIAGPDSTLARDAAELGDPDIAMFFATAFERPMLAAFAERHFRGNFACYEAALRSVPWYTSRPNTHGARFARSRPIAPGKCHHVRGARCELNAIVCSDFCEFHHGHYTLIELFADENFVYAGMPHDPPIGTLFAYRSAEDVIYVSATDRRCPGGPIGIMVKDLSVKCQ